MRDGKVYLHFKLPKNTGGEPLTGCVVKVEPGGRMVNIPPRSPWNVDIIAEGELYTFAVAAKNKLGTGPFSRETSAVRFKRNKGRGPNLAQIFPLPQFPDGKLGPRQKVSTLAA